MITEKTTNTLRNSFWGILFRLFSLVCPFVIRTAIISVLGMEYCGLNSLFASVLQILSISELGFSGAMVYSMYEPIANGENYKVGAILSLYKKIYRYIGTFIAFAGISVLPFLDCFIKGDVPPDLNIYILYSLYLLNTILGYFLFSYRRSLFVAAQRSDIENKTLICSNFLMYAGQIVAIMALKNYYVYVVFIPLTTILGNIIIYHLSKKYFPLVTCEGRLSDEQKTNIKQKVKALLGHKIGGVIVSTIDNIVVSSLFGLLTLGIFNNYYYIVLTISGFIDILFASAKASIGNSFVTNDTEKNWKDFCLLNYFNGWLVMICSVCLFLLLQPFMYLWVGSHNTFTTETSYMFVILFMIWNLRKVTLVYKDASGNWERDWLKPYVESIFNIVLSILFAMVFGIKGVLLSTILCMSFICIPWEIFALNRGCFNKRYCEFFYPLLKPLLLSVTLMILCGYVTKDIKYSSFISFFVYSLIYFVIVLLVFVCVFRKNHNVRQLYNRVKKVQHP